MKNVRNEVEYVVASRMSSYYSGDHTAGDHIHMNTTTGNNTVEPKKKYRLGTVSN